MGNEMNICDVCGANYVKKDDTWKCPACGYFKSVEVTKEEKVLLCNASQQLRLTNFQDAEELYSDFIAQYPKNAEGYWGRLRARYGIKYEDDIDGKKVPTISAMSIESVLGDSDYLSAIAFANKEPKKYYEREANKIEELRKEWIDKASKEEPVDIFISFKDSDSENNIARTHDSIGAQELYAHLITEGYKVFFSRVSLDRKHVGEKYEPYIFNAINTARAMIIYTSKKEYLESTWIKNEWLRYLKKIRNGEKEKNSLILAYENMLPSEFPTVFKNMQCMDASKKTFYGDLDNHLKKVLSKAEGESARLAKQRVEEEMARLAKQKSEEEVARLVKQKVEEDKQENTLEFAWDDDLEGYVVTKLIDKDIINLIIPSQYQDKAVVGIGNSALSYCSGLKSITIPDSVRSIGAGAFYECSGLISIIIPDSVVSIGNHMFGGCVELTSIVIPDSVTSIGDSAFWRCVELKSITIPNSVTSIGSWAFSWCSGLKSITIPNSVTSIGDSAFWRCVELKSITIPKSVTSIGKGAFERCDGLTSITIPDSVTSIGEFAFKGCCGLESIIIPSSVTSIGDSAFCNCSGLTSITIPSRVTSIGDWTFDYCSGLTSITIPDSVTSIGMCAFDGCSGLTSITIPNRVTSIGMCAFDGCSGLESIIIPSSVTSMDGWVFEGFGRKQTIYVKGGKTATKQWNRKWRRKCKAKIIYD